MKEAKEIRTTVFKGINKYSPKESWKRAIDYSTKKMAEIRAVNGPGFHNWRMCKDILAKEFGKLFVEKKVPTDAEIMRDISIKDELAISLKK